MELDFSGFCIKCNKDIEGITYKNVYGNVCSKCKRDMPFTKLDLRFIRHLLVGEKEFMQTREESELGNAIITKINYLLDKGIKE